MVNESVKIDKEKFKFVNTDEKLHDKKLDTKPVSYMRDALRRFKSNRSSVVAFFIIAFLIVFSALVTIFSQYSVSDRFNYYNYVPPKITANAYGWWDGCESVTLSQMNYYNDLAIGVESGRAVVKGKVTQKTVDGKTLYSYRRDKYNLVGYKLIQMTESEYTALKNYQNETGIQVIYPMPSSSLMKDKSNYNYWYQTDSGGLAVLDENGNFINIYMTLDSTSYGVKLDRYDSLRVDGDPAKGADDPTTVDGRYVYAQRSGNGYAVRVCYYDYFVYTQGHEPVFVFGVNESGQDLLTCVASGTLFSLLLGVCVATINFILGSIYGAIEGYYGGRTDLIMERVSDILSGIPFIVLATLFQLNFASTWGPIPSLLFAFVLTGWIGTASRVRMQFYRFKGQEYVLAARTLGARDMRIIGKHIFPNALGTIITGAALAIPSVIFSESMLSYLGIINLSVSSITSLGTLLSGGQSYLSTYPHIIAFPAIAIALLMISFNLFGNGLRDAFNPSLRGTED